MDNENSQYYYTDKSSFGKICTIKSVCLKIAEIIAVSVLIFWFSYFVHNPFCGFIFQCGCSWAWKWDDGWKHCNIHNTHGPYCPWCVAKPGVEWLINTDFVDVLMFTGFCAAAFYQWHQEYQMQVMTNNTHVINNDSYFYDFSSAGLKDRKRFDSHDSVFSNQIQKWFKSFLKRIWVPFFIFTVYDIILGVIFFLGSPHYPWFMWWKRST